MADKTLAIIALVCAFLIPPLGVILGIVALTKHAGGRGPAIAAIVIGAILTLALPFLILVGSIAYYGVLNPATMIPERCAFTAGVQCTDWDYVNDGAQSRFELIITNGIGYQIELEEVRLSSSDLSGTCEVRYDDPVVIGNGAQHLITAQGPGCSSTAEGIRARIEFDYKVTGGINRTRTLDGEIYVRNR